jgi:hypothetical protein
LNNLKGRLKLDIPVQSIISIWKKNYSFKKESVNSPVLIVNTNTYIIQIISVGKNLSLQSYIIPTDPAVKPTARKKTNSSKSLGKEFTIRLIWVIWPCAPQVYKLKKI